MELKFRCLEIRPNDMETMMCKILNLEGKKKAKIF